MVDKIQLCNIFSTKKNQTNASFKLYINRGKHHFNLEHDSIPDFIINFLNPKNVQKKKDKMTK